MHFNKKVLLFYIPPKRCQFKMSASMVIHLNQNEISDSGKDLQDRDTSIDGDNIVRDTEDESDVTEDSDDSDSDGDFGAYIVPLENTEVTTDGAVDVDDSSTDDEDVVNVDDINIDIEDTGNDDDAVTNDERSEYRGYNNKYTAVDSDEHRREVEDDYNESAVNTRDEDETDVKNFRNIELYVPTQIVSTDEHEVDLPQVKTEVSESVNNDIVNDTGCANSDTVESNSEIDDNCNRPIPRPRRLRKPPDRFKDFHLYQMVEDRSIDRRLNALDNLFKSGVLSRIDSDIAHTIICNIMK
ncbi:hypothetical protein ACF0H5_008338 [Mactra antiquata]